MGRAALIGRTLAVVCGVALLYSAIFIAQMLLGIGPVGATLTVPAGSPRWFNAAETWVRLDALLVWPIVIAVGAVAQRLWCRDAPLWTVVFVALPAILTLFGLSVGRAVGLGSIYIATAVVIGALSSLLSIRARRSA